MTAADLHVLLWLSSHRVRPIDVVGDWVMDLSTSRSAVLLVAVLCAVYVVVARRWRLAVAVVGAVVVTYGASLLLKDLFAVRRPAPSLARVYADGWSFPSTDSAITAAAATALYLGMTWVAGPVRRRLAWVLAAGVGAVGFLVVYLGAHWPSDVLAGWVLGAGVGVGAVALAHRLPRRTAPRPASG